MLKKGVFCISIDVELLWGRHDRDWRKFVPVVAHSRSIIKEVLELLEQYKISATWAIVGHLFLDSCQTVKGIKHPEITRPRFPKFRESCFQSCFQKDWFASDPASSTEDDPGWYGRDIVRLIKKHPRQEIACHSFSHVIFGDPSCNKETAESEIRACIALAKKEGIKLTSFIFPRNSVGHLSILKKFGFTAYRGMEADVFRRTKLAKLLTFFSPLSPPIHSPTHNEGLVNVPTSMYLSSSRGLRRFVPNYLIVSAAKRGIDQAVRERRVFHLWTHPEDLYDNDKTRKNCFNNMLEYVAMLSDQKKLEVHTLAEIASGIKR